MPIIFRSCDCQSVTETFSQIIYYIIGIENANEKQCPSGNDKLDIMLDSLVVMKAEGTVGSAAEANLEIWKLSARPGLTCTDPDYFKI